MNPKAFPAEKRAKIAATPVEELLTLIKEIPPNVLSELSHDLPKINGFRVGQPAHVQQQVRTFLRQLKGPPDSHQTKEAMRMFEKVWIAWSGELEGFADLLNSYDNKADFEGGNPVPPNSPLDIGFIEVLVKASSEGKVSREDIKRFYDFGYFLPDPALDSLIAKAQPRQALQELRKNRDLPKRIDGLEQRLAESDGRITSACQEIERVSEDLRASKDALSSAIEKVKAIESRVTVGASKSELDSIKARTEKLGVDLGTHLRKYEALDLEVKRTVKTLADVQGQQTKLNSDANDASRRIQALEDEVRGQGERTFDLEKRASSKLEERLGAVDQRIASLVSSIAKQPNVAQTSNGTSSHAIRVQSVPASPAPQVFLTVERAFAALADNLLSVGMALGAARSLSREIVSAATAGQIPMLCGSGALAIADIVSTTFGGQHCSRVSIPIGLLGSDELSQAIEYLGREASGRESVTVVVLEGLNRSAIEAYGDSLVRLVSSRVLGLKDPAPGLMILGTVLEGPSTLGLPVGLTELGPLFHTDILSWVGPADPSKMSAGAISKDPWGKAIAAAADSRSERARIEDYRNAMEGSPSLLWQRGLDSAFKRLNFLVQAGTPPTALQSLVCGWLIPRAVATSLHKSAFEKLLGDGRVDATTADQRIGKLLRFFWPDTKTKQ